MSDWSGTTGKNISGTTDLAPLDEQAKCIKELFPDAKNIGIIYCSSEPNSIYQSTTITKYLEDEGYTVKEYTFSDSNDVAAVTQSACDASDAIYIPTDNTAASCTEAINNVASQAKKPIFAGEEGIAKGCGVATLSISYYDLGYTTGEMAYDILVMVQTSKLWRLRALLSSLRSTFRTAPRSLELQFRTAMRKSQLNKQLHYGGI